MRLLKPDLADTLPFQGGNASIEEGMHEEKNMSQKKKGGMRNEKETGTSHFAGGKPAS